MASRPARPGCLSRRARRRAGSRRRPRGSTGGRRPARRPGAGRGTRRRRRGGTCRRHAASSRRRGPCRADGVLRTGHEVFGADVAPGDVEAVGEPVLGQQHRLAGGRHLHAAHDHPHLARGGAHVDPVVRVADVAEDLLVLVEPGVHTVPVDGDEPAQPLGAGERLGVVPDRVLREAVAGLDGLVVRDALERAVRVVGAGDQQVGVDVLAGHVQLRQEGGFVHQGAAHAVQDRTAAEEGADATREGVLEEAVRGAVDAVVDGLGCPRCERAAREGERHGLLRSTVSGRRGWLPVRRAAPRPLRCPRTPRRNRCRWARW